MSNEKRKSISKSLRFEVFKRDCFTCQYCGKSAPDVVLEVDHIVPVKEGGDNSILNLIAACFDCNRGKGARKLSDNIVVKKQQEQLKALSERREQMEMMLKWKEELLNIENDQIKAIENILSPTEYGLSDIGKRDVKKLIKRVGFEIVVDAAQASIHQYFVPGDKASIDKVFDFISRIAYTMYKRKSDPFIHHKNRIRYYMRNNYAYINENSLIKTLDRECRCDFDCGLVMEIAKDSQNWTQFCDGMKKFFGIEV